MFSTNRDEIDRDPKKFPDAADVVPGGRRQIADPPDFPYRFLPTRKLLDLEFEIGCPGARKPDALPVQPISGHDSEALDAGQHIEFCDRGAGRGR